MFGMFDPPNDTTRLTVELREIAESGVDIWNFAYPSFYTGEDKKTLEQKIIDHYYFRQIGQETVGRWLHKFRTRIREIMPYYSQLYGTVKIMDELPSPFDNVDVVETFEETRSENQSSNARNTASDNSTRRHADTPQGSVDNINTHMSALDVDTSTGDSLSSGESRGQSTVKHTYTKKGNQGVNTYAHDMTEYRQTLLNIDRMIIDELADLFIMVY